LLLIVVNADRSTRGRLLVFLVRLLEGWADETSQAAGWAGLKRRVVPRSRQSLPVRWEESTWSTPSAASMNDVDADEHWQTIGRPGTVPAGRGGAWLGTLLVIASVHLCPISCP
jgi:hypothetical protein